MDSGEKVKNENRRERMLKVCSSMCTRLSKCPTEVHMAGQSNIYSSQTPTLAVLYIPHMHFLYCRALAVQQSLAPELSTIVTKPCQIRSQ